MIKLQRHNIAAISDTRWKAAQNAERKAFDSWKDKAPTTWSRFFSRNFLLTSEFFCGKSILEVGCSPVAALHSIGEARFKVGVDPLTREWRLFYRDGTNHIQGMGEYLPFKDESFDAALCINVLDHVQNPSAALKEIQRCLKKGGTLVLWLQTFSTFRIIRRGLSLIDAPHPHHFSDGEISLLLQQLGININYHRCEKASDNSAISVMKAGQLISGLKSLFANWLLGLHESAYICLRTT